MSLDSGPAWVKAPPPQYHTEEAGRLIDPPQSPSGVSAASLSTIRCPKCKETFSWTAERPTKVVCPHCGVKGALK